MNKLQGTMITNAFLHSAKTDEIYRHLSESAKRFGLGLDLATNADFLARLDTGECIPMPSKRDFILFWNKDVSLGQSLESNGLRLFNPSEGIRNCDNKALTAQVLSTSGIKLPKTIKVPVSFASIGYWNSDFIDKIADLLGYPFIIKECWGSFGKQVYLATSKEEAVDIFSAIDGTECIAQEYISQSRGRDLRAYVVGDRVVAAIERSNKNDFRANIAIGGSARPYRVSAEQEQMAVNAVKALGLDFAGVDMMFLENDSPILCEVNTNAQFLGLIEATGINVADAIFEHIIRTMGN